LKKLSIVTDVRVFLLPIFMFVISGCGVLERPTGYSANPSIDGGYTIETCDESEFEDKWWAFETDNAAANTFVPAYQDYCTYVSPDLVFFWNLEEQYGYYNYDFDWECENENTMKIVDRASKDVSRVKIYGLLPNGCYSVKVSYDGLSAKGEICPCEYNGP
tara:strand:+ start:354 stop:836 length:483 start_codon:yes stop_codon:yes gene_type:complete